MPDPKWMKVARSLIGTRETPGGADNPEILRWARDLGGLIAKTYKHDATPWCALYVCHVLRTGGQKWIDTLWALNYAKYGQKLPGPVVGAVVCGKRSGGGHVGFIAGRDSAGNLMVLGGNQSDAVNVRPFRRSWAVAYRWPPGAPFPNDAGFHALPVVRSDGRIADQLAALDPNIVPVDDAGGIPDMLPVVDDPTLSKAEFPDAKGPFRKIAEAGASVSPFAAFMAYLTDWKVVATLCATSLVGVVLWFTRERWMPWLRGKAR